MVGVQPKQFQRTYPGNIKLNFSLCLSASNDFKKINYSNFYLTNDYKFSDVFDVGESKIKSKNIYTPIQYGSTYLKFSIAQPDEYSNVNRYQDHFNYGNATFTQIANQYTNFTIKLLDDNTCNIYYTYRYQKYYLVADDNNKV